MSRIARSPMAKGESPADGLRGNPTCFRSLVSLRMGVWAEFGVTHKGHLKSGPRLFVRHYAYPLTLGIAHPEIGMKEHRSSRPVNLLSRIGSDTICIEATAPANAKVAPGTEHCQGTRSGRTASCHPMPTAKT